MLRVLYRLGLGEDALSGVLLVSLTDFKAGAAVHVFLNVLP